MRRTAIAAHVFAIAGSAIATPSHSSIHDPDPYERYNRRAYAFNVQLDKAVIRPLSRLTHGLTPSPIGDAIANVLVTLNEPIVILNDLLQVRPGRAVKTSVRLALNVTIGLLGTVDAAKRLGLPHHPNGFGDTLGRYGVGPGPYIYLPVIGPGDLRDIIGGGVDGATTPISFVRYAYKNDVQLALNIVGGLNRRGDVDNELTILLSDAADPYATLRATYLQSRQGEINGDRVPDILPDIGDEAPMIAAPATPPITAAPGSPAANPSLGVVSSETPSAVAGGQSSLPADQAGPLQPLPDQQRGEPDHKVPSPLQ